LSSDQDRYGLEEWREFARPFFDVIPTGRPKAFRAYATSDKLGRLVVSDVGFDAAIFDRDPRQLRGFDTEFLLLETYDSGSNRGRSGDLVTKLDTGSVQVFDMAQRWVSRTTAVVCRSVVIPYDIVGYDPSRHPAHACLTAGSPRNAMLLAAMGALFDARPGLEPEDADALAESFCAVVRNLVFNQREREAEDGQAEGQALFLRRFIEERLAEPDLGPQRLCDALDISRTTLYRMFSEHGGVRGYITARRLDRCFDQLRQGRPRRGRVREVAERWGFFDAKSFNRAFRSRYGIAPSDCLDPALDIGTGSAAGHPVNDWMRRL
jgi:AraC-like DNA-binding protein